MAAHERLKELSEKFRELDDRHRTFCAVAKFPISANATAWDAFENEILMLLLPNRAGVSTRDLRNGLTPLVHFDRSPLAESATERLVAFWADSWCGQELEYLTERAFEALPVTERNPPLPIRLEIEQWRASASSRFLWLQWSMNTLLGIPGAIGSELDCAIPCRWFVENFCLASADAIDVFVKGKSTQRWGDSAELAKMAGMTVAATRSKLSRLRAARKLPVDACKSVGDGREEFHYLIDATMPLLKPKVKS